MANYLHLFETRAAHDAVYNSEAYKRPWVAYIEETDDVSFDKIDRSNGHAYVDLGLPSGTLWATMNIGATGETDYGLYFAWGETQGYTAEQVGTERNFSSDAYAFGPINYSDSTNRGITKYNVTDGKSTLDLVDDAASVNWGGGWHMPTNAQLYELSTNTTTAWTTVNGVNGIRFTSRLDSSKSIFLPAGGFCELGDVYGIGEHVRYFSNTIHSLNSTDLVYAKGLDGNSTEVSNVILDRFFGFSIRGVLG